MKKQQNNSGKQSHGNTGKQAAEQLDQLQAQADKERPRKAGSQSNQSDRHNTGRGGGK